MTAADEACAVGMREPEEVQGTQARPGRRPGRSWWWWRMRGTALAPEQAGAVSPRLPRVRLLPTGVQSCSLNPRPDLSRRRRPVPSPAPRHRSDRPLTFRDVVEYGFEIKGFTFDSYAERHLYFAPPAAVTRLSGFRTAPDRCVLRYAVAERQEQEQAGAEEAEEAGAGAAGAAAGGGAGGAGAGERAILTFGLECRVSGGWAAGGGLGHTSSACALQPSEDAYSPARLQPHAASLLS
mgnify:CR=1 FL=1